MSLTFTKEPGRRTLHVTGMEMPGHTIPEEMDVAIRVAGESTVSTGLALDNVVIPALLAAGGPKVYVVLVLWTEGHSSQGRLELRKQGIVAPSKAEAGRLVLNRLCEGYGDSADVKDEVWVNAKYGRRVLDGEYGTIYVEVKKVTLIARPIDVIDALVDLQIPDDG